jgi:hypothetical protein
MRKESAHRRRSGKSRCGLRRSSARVHRETCRSMPRDGARTHRRPDAAPNRPDLIPPFGDRHSLWARSLPPAAAVQQEAMTHRAE